MTDGVEMAREVIRAGRAALGWSLNKLATKSGVSLSTVREFERGSERTSASVVRALREALQRAGALPPDMTSD